MDFMVTPNTGDKVAVSNHSWSGGHKRYSRRQFPLVLAQFPPATVVMEACGSAHFWARHRHQGHARGLPQRGDPY
jgi:transposase